jgi:hypothetical protein
MHIERRAFKTSCDKALVLLWKQAEAPQMAQDNQNRDQQGQGQDQGQGQTNPNSDQITRETRGTGSSDSQPIQGGSSRPDKSQDLEDADELDEDRDDDDRGDGSPNRRNNIG